MGEIEGELDELSHVRGPVGGNAREVPRDP